MKRLVTLFRFLINNRQALGSSNIIDMIAIEEVWLEVLALEPIQEESNEICSQPFKS